MSKIKSRKPVRVSSIRYALAIQSAKRKARKRFHKLYPKKRDRERAKKRGILKAMITKAIKKERERFVEERNKQLVPLIMEKLGYREQEARELAAQSLSTIAITIGAQKYYNFRRHGKNVWRKYDDKGRFVGYVSTANMKRSIAQSKRHAAMRLLAIRYGLSMAEVRKQYKWEAGQIKYR